LDQTSEWWEHPELHKYSADTPLTALGHTHAEETGKVLSEVSQKSKIPFALIVSSPYLRCAQTASWIARVLGVPVQFDRDLGEVSHAELWEDGKPPRIRDHDELKTALQTDFPNVDYLKDESGSLQIRGKVPQSPERIQNARLRFCFKVQELTRQAANKLSSIIIVTHADSVAAVTSLLMPSWELRKIPYTGYLVASRQVKVFDKRANMGMSAEPVYGRQTGWTVELGPGFECQIDERYEERNRGETRRLKDSKQELKATQSTNSLGYLPAPSEAEVVDELISQGSSKKEASRLAKLARGMTKQGFLGEKPVQHAEQI